MLRTAVDLLNDLGVTVIAEGIEDIASVATLTGLTISHGQGFGLGRPQPLDQLLEQLRTSPVVEVGATIARPLRVVDLRR